MLSSDNEPEAVTFNLATSITFHISMGTVLNIKFYYDILVTITKSEQGEFYNEKATIR